MSVKEPVQDQEALLKALRVISALSIAADSHKNVIPAGKIGREKYKNTDFSDIKSIEDNAIEGTDVMENIGFEPGGVPAYALGNAYDVLNPVNLALSAASKLGGVSGRLAKIFSLTETIAEEGGKKVVKKAMPEYIEKNLRHLKDLPKAGRIAEEAIETGASKHLGNPKKALEIIEGTKKRVKTGGTKELPIEEIKKSDGTLDKIGQDIEAVVREESKTAGKVNKGKIHRAEMDKLKKENNRGVKYRKSEQEKDTVLRDALSPYERKTKTIEVPPQRKMKNTSSEDIEAELSSLEEVLARKKAERDHKYFTPADEPPPIPKTELPPLPSEHDDMGLEELLATVSDKKAKKAEVDAANAAVDAHNKSAKPTLKTVEYDADVHSTIAELWEKRVALRKEFKESTLGKPVHEWTDKDKTLEGVIDQIEEEITRLMSIPGRDKYLGSKQKYGAQAKLAQIFEDQLQSEMGGKGKGARIAAEAAAGGATNPGTIGRLTKEITDAVAGPKRRVQFGNLMQNRTVTTPLMELMSEITEAPFDPPYLKDETERTEESDVDFSEVPAMPTSSEVETPDTGRMPASAVQIPEAEEVDDIMAPDAEVDLSSVPSMAPQSDIDQKMDETLSPSKPMFDPYVNEEVLNTFLPRDSKRILANPTALMAKIQQVAPNQASFVQEMLQNDPEGLEEAGPKLAIMFPALFEKDKYGAFDGKIIDPMMQQKFLADLSQDEEMDSIAKANMAMKVRRGESIHE